MGSCATAARGGRSPSPMAPVAEVIFKGDRHRFIEGEYVSIRESDGITRTFRVAAVRAAPAMPR